MLSFLVKRLVMAIAVGWTVSVVVFLLLHTATDPAMAIAGADAPQAVIDAVREQYGFNRPLGEQYFAWLGNFLSGDLGTSYHLRRPVLDLIVAAAPTTIRLALFGILVSIVIAIPLGMLAGLYRNSIVDRFAMAFCVCAQAVPSFWLCLIAILVFAVMIPIFPVSGDYTWRHYILPVLVLGITSVPPALRLTRSGMIDAMNSDYMRTARAKGYRNLALVTRHGLRNALLPVVSVLAVQLGNKLGGSILVESVFALKGLGRLSLESIIAGDIPTLNVLVILFSMTFIVLTMVADLLNAWLDPRVRLG